MSAPAVPLDGVSLRYLRAFIEFDHGRRVSALNDQEGATSTLPDKFEDMSTDDVNEKIVKRAVLSGQSVVDMIRNSPDMPQQDWLLCGLPPSEAPRLVGKATVFVSHAWKCSFARLVETVEATVRDDDAERRGEKLDPDSVFLWVDILSVVQRDAPKWTTEEWAQKFRHAVASFGTTLVVMEPWNKPICTTRAWCLWEIFSTVSTESNLLVGYHPTDFDKVGAAAGETMKMFRVFAAIDVSTAECRSKEDRAMILSDITRSMGADAGMATLNRAVRAALRQRAGELPAFKENLRKREEKIEKVVTVQLQGMYIILGAMCCCGMVVAAIRKEKMMMAKAATAKVGPAPEVEAQQQGGGGGRSGDDVEKGREEKEAAGLGRGGGAAVAPLEMVKSDPAGPAAAQEAPIPVGTLVPPTPPVSAAALRARTCKAVTTAIIAGSGSCAFTIWAWATLGTAWGCRDELQAVDWAQQYLAATEVRATIARWQDQLRNASNATAAWAPPPPPPPQLLSASPAPPAPQPPGLLLNVPAVEVDTYNRLNGVLMWPLGEKGIFDSRCYSLGFNPGGPYIDWIAQYANVTSNVSGADTVVVITTGSSDTSFFSASDFQVPTGLLGTDSQGHSYWLSDQTIFSFIGAAVYLLAITLVAVVPLRTKLSAELYGWADDSLILDFMVAPRPLGWRQRARFAWRFAANQCFGRTPVALSVLVGCFATTSIAALLYVIAWQGGEDATLTGTAVSLGLVWAPDVIQAGTLGTGVVDSYKSEMERTGRIFWRGFQLAIVFGAFVIELPVALWRLRRILRMLAAASEATAAGEDLDDAGAAGGGKDATAAAAAPPATAPPALAKANVPA